MPEEAVLQDMFVREKPVKVLLGLKTSKDFVYATLLSKEANCTYSHAIKILNLFKKANLVTFEKSGRIKKVRLTEDGRRIALDMEAAVKTLQKLEEGLVKEEKKPAKKKKAEK
jgi:predicted transcriptional regulator